MEVHAHSHTARVTFIQKYIELNVELLEELRNKYHIKD